MTKLLAIDPGSNLAYSYWEGDTLMSYSQFKTNVKATMAERSLAMEVNIQNLYEEFAPNRVVLENILPGAHCLKSADAIFWLVTTYCDVIRGAILYPLERPKAEGVMLVSPSTLKKALTGSGRASKSMVINAVNERLGLKLKQKDHNLADAIGLGIYGLENWK